MTAKDVSFALGQKGADSELLSASFVPSWELAPLDSIVPIQEHRPLTESSSQENC